MPERIRVRCPICGQLPYVEQLEALSDESAEVRIFLHKWGGKKPVDQAAPPSYVKKGRGSAPGFIETTDVTENSKDQVVYWAKFFLGRVRKFIENQQSTLGGS